MKESPDMTRIAERPAMRELVPLGPDESFRWCEHNYPDPIARWNYHPEIEIHLIRETVGSYIIGNEIGEFAPGHVAVVGAGVPHDWVSDLEPGEVCINRDAVVQFTPAWLESVAESVPELHRCQDFVRQSRRGIVYSGPTAKRAARAIEELGAASGVLRVALFFALVDLLATAPESDRRYAADEVYAWSVGGEGHAAADAGIAYVLENLTGDIRMSEAARLAYMSEPTFSKLFKKASGMTFSNFVRRLRIANACRLLDQTSKTIGEISTSVGYGTLANFNRQFLTETGMTPSAYRQRDRPPSHQ